MTAITYSEKTKQFLNFEDDRMHPSLVEAVIEQFGGEEAFLEVWEDVCDSIAGVSGWTDNPEKIAFYNKNREKILEFLKLLSDEFYYDTLSEAISDWGSLDGKYSIKDIEAALNDSSSKHHDTIAEACAMCVGQETARFYQMFYENYEESNERKQGNDE